MERGKKFKSILLMLPFDQSGLRIVTNAPRCLVESEKNVTNWAGQRMYLHFQFHHKTNSMQDKILLGSVKGRIDSLL